jgi:uncharacterized protein YdeI (BOF family)
LRLAAAIVVGCVLVVGLGLGSLRAENICKVQAYDAATGYSPLTGSTVTLKGIVTVPSGIFQPTRTSIYIRGLGSDDCGVNVYSSTPIQGIELGDSIIVRGQVQEYVSTGGNGSITEVVFSSSADLTLRHGVGAPEPVVVSTGQAAQETSEGKLVRVTGTLVTALLGTSFTMDDGSGEIEIYDFGGAFASDSTWRALEFGDEVTVTGVVSQADASLPYLNDYRINPRHPNYGDISTPHCIPGGSPKAYLDLGGAIFSPEYGETIKMIYSGPNGARLRLRIFDVSGRCVANLVDAIFLCSETEFSWDGRNEVKELLPSGLYHVVVTATDPESGSESQQVLPLVIGRRLK